MAAPRTIPGPPPLLPLLRKWSTQSQLGACQNALDASLELDRHHRERREVADFVAGFLAARARIGDRATG
jgi:hypothetical protein